MLEDSANNMSAVLGPFDQRHQDLMKNVDKVCRKEAAKITEKARQASLAGEELQLDEETAGWAAIITAYGLLYNRAVECGWIEDVFLEKHNDEQDKT